MFGSLATIVALATLLHSSVANPHGRATVKQFTGMFTDGATYLIELPPTWNGTFVLYSHGYRPPGSQNPAVDAPDKASGDYLLSQGFALGGSSYKMVGWDVADALPDQIHVLDTFAQLVRPPALTIAWGQSMGGLVTAGLIQQDPSRFNAALPMCGVVSGAVAQWDIALDASFTFNTLLASNSLQVVGITNPTANVAKAVAAIDAAQKTPQGRARIALVAAVADVPGWYGPQNPQPSPTDYPSQESGQYDALRSTDFNFDFAYRAELEMRAGGNPSFNTGVDYRRQLANSADAAEVRALYQSAGLNLDADLNALAAAPRISASPVALTYLSDNIILNGKIAVPVLSMHTEGDDLVVNQSESAYAAAVRQARNGPLLRDLFVHRAGHCQFTSGETLAAFLALNDRLVSGAWSGLQPAHLNAVANRLGNNMYAPAFDTFASGPFLRTYNGTPP